MSVRAARIGLWLGLLAAAAIFAANLDRPLANPDEGRYAEIAREMEASGDWVTPRLNGIKYFEKPPLQYWAGALAFRAFGAGEWQARLYGALCALGTLLVVAYTGRARGPPGAGAAAALVLAASPYFLAMGATLTLDMGLAFWTTLTFCAWLLAERAQAGARERHRWMLAAWAAMAMAVLSKGLVGVLFPAAALAIACVLRRDFTPLARLEWGVGLVVFLAIAAPWFVLVSYANPEFPRFFLVHEHLQRYLTESHGRAEPWWFFLPIVAAGLLPWSFALPAAIAHGWRPGLRPHDVEATRLAIVYGLFVIAFFSASGSKLPGYVLPAFPPLALVLGRYLAEAPAARIARQAAAAGPLALVAVALAAALPWLAREPWTRELYAAARPWALAGAILLVAAALLAAAALARGRRLLALASASLATVAALHCVAAGYGRLTPRQSSATIAPIVQAHLAPGTRLYSVGFYEQSLTFYLGRTVTLVAFDDEFGPGLRREPHRSIARLEDFAAHWLRPGEALAIIYPDAYRTLRAEGLPMQLLHEDPRRVLVRKP